MKGISNLDIYFKFKKICRPLRLVVAIDTDRAVYLLPLKGIEHAISNSDKGREKSGNNSWQDIGLLAESMDLCKVWLLETHC